MMRRLSLQQRKDGARRRGSRAIVLVADRRIDGAAERLRLGIFVSGEQAAEQIARIPVLDVERHGNLHCKIADEHGFQHGDAQTVDVVVGAQPHEKGGEERQRIGGAGEDRPQPLAGEIGRHVLRLALRRRFDEQPPDGRTFVFRRRLDAHSRDMREKAVGDRSEIILEIEAHRKPRRVGREAEHEEAHALRQVGL